MTNSLIKIKVNGDDISINKGLSIFDLIKNFKIQPSKIAVELNGEIIPKSSYNIEIKENNNIEIVHFIGGG